MYWQGLYSWPHQWDYSQYPLIVVAYPVLYYWQHSPYAEHEIYQAQRRLYSLLQSGSSAGVQQLIQENHQSTRPFSPYDRRESQASQVLLPSCCYIYQSIQAACTKEEMESLKKQRRFFKCDYCDFKEPSRGEMVNHLGITGHLHAAEIMGSFENETFHCKSIIEPDAVDLFTRKKSMNNLTDLVIMCPICFGHFSTMYQCSIHALKSHGQNVYGLGEVVGQHVIFLLPSDLKCLCGKQFKKESQIRNHVNTCKNYQTNSDPNFSFLYVCPFCIQFFNNVAFYRHIEKETRKRNHRGDLSVHVIHVRRPTASRAMLPYACGYTLQDTSETRVIYRQDKKKALKAWRKYKRSTLRAYEQMTRNNI